MIKVLDLFSGIGGFSKGLEDTGGFETIAFCEIDPYCRKILKKHWPDKEIFNDVTNLKFKENVDLVTAGFPCQDISFAGPGAGLSGERSGLFWYILRTACMVGRPRLLLENVAALLNRGLCSVLGALASFGYDAEWHCIPASYVGAPHQRDRIWIMANSNDRGERIQGVIQEEIYRIKGFSWCKNVGRVENLRGRPDIPEPLIRRTGNGVSQRLHALGNSIIPQIPKMIGYAILEEHHKYG